MQKFRDPSGFLANSTGAPHGNQDGHIAPASKNTSNYFLISNYSWGLCLYIVFCTGLVPSTRGISSTSPSFRLGSVRMGMYQGIYRHTYIIQYVAMTCSSHPHLVSMESLLPEGLYFLVIFLTKITWGYLVFLIMYHI